MSGFGDAKTAWEDQGFAALLARMPWRSHLDESQRPTIAVRSDAEGKADIGFANDRLIELIRLSGESPATSEVVGARKAVSLQTGTNGETQNPD